MAYIVQQPGQKLTAEEIMEWVAKQVGISLLFLGYTVLSISCCFQSWSVRLKWTLFRINSSDLDAMISKSELRL